MKNTRIDYIALLQLIGNIILYRVYPFIIFLYCILFVGTFIFFISIGCLIGVLITVIVVGAFLYFIYFQFEHYKILTIKKKDHTINAKIKRFFPKNCSNEYVKKVFTNDLKEIEKKYKESGEKFSTVTHTIFVAGILDILICEKVSKEFGHYTRLIKPEDSFEKTFYNNDVKISVKYLRNKLNSNKAIRVRLLPLSKLVKEAKKEPFFKVTIEFLEPKERNVYAL